MTQLYWIDPMSQWPEESARIKDAPGILSADVEKVKRNPWQHPFGSGRVAKERENAWISSKYCILCFLQINVILIYASNENTLLHGLFSIKNVMFIINFSFPSQYIGLLLLQSAILAKYVWSSGPVGNIAFCGEPYLYNFIGKWKETRLFMH